MTPVVIGLCCLLSLSLLLCFALAVAWRRFGRELHAALWSLAYGLSAANWTSNLLMTWLRPNDGMLTLFGAICTVGSFALIALGFRRRAGLPLRVDAIVAVAGVTVLIVALGLAQAEGLGTQRWLVLFFCTAMLMVSAFSLRNSVTRRSVAGAAPFWMLVLFAAYTLGLGLLATTVPVGPEDAEPALRLFRLAVILGVPTGLFGVGLFAMFLLAADLVEGMRQLASSDPLTGLLNRRGLEQAAEQAIATCRRGNRSLAVVVADIDHFKRVNDGLGHAVGDIVLRRFADHAGAVLRQGDLLGRLGGEEFVFVLPDTGITQGLEAVERFRAGLAEVVGDIAPQLHVTASYGIAALIDEDDTLARALHRADQALYRSKIEGRDRITIATAELVTVERLRPVRAPVGKRRAVG